MIIYSEITEQKYDSVEECLKAEKAHMEAERKRKEEAENKQKELDKAYDEAISAAERYFELAGIDEKLINDPLRFIEFLFDF